MLDNLDVVLSFATIMLGVSLLITVLTQTVSALLNLRGQQLKKGLVVLFEQSKVDQKLHTELAEAALKHPLVADGVLFVRCAPAIRKGELLRLLARLPQLKHLPEEAEKLQQTVDEWFDSTMDRVAHRFSALMRLWTILFSFAMALALHLDAANLLTRLSADSGLRQSLVASSTALESRAQQVLKAAPNAALASDDTMKAVLEQAQGIRSDLAKSQFELVPASYEDYFAGTPNPLWGIIASAVLLSLGAPFWFNLLRTASTLRPVMANKVDEDETRAAAGSGAPDSGVIKAA
jgi:hypothetical protein